MQKIGDIPNTRADSNGEFTDGNVAGGVPPTILPAAWFNTIQRELMSILTAAEIEADPHSFNQVLSSIQKLVSDGIPDLKDASLNQKGIVQLSNATNSTSEKTAATPKAVSDLGKLLLKITNNLSEIKDAGPEAVAQTLANLGLDDVIRKSDTNVQLPGKLTTKGDIKATEGDLYSGDARLEHDGNIFADVWGDSLFAYINRMRNTASLGESGWHRDAATGTIRQWGRTPAFGAGAGFLINFPIPFPTKIVSVNGILIRPGNTSTGSAETLYIGEPSSLTSVRTYHGGSETYPALWEVEGY
ncbi:TPA: tail fiber protein [Yersinia enterocolitica]|nr:tail fiber protein [Yersinia enterocolitica]